MRSATGKRPVEPHRRREGESLSLSQSMRDTLRIEADRRDMSRGRLAEKWMRDGMTLDPELAHLSTKTGTNRAS